MAIRSSKIIQLIIWVAIFLAVALFAPQFLHKVNDNGSQTSQTTIQSSQNHTSDNQLSPEKRIETLTQQNTVAEFIKQNKRLPDYYVTKRQAQQQGWDARSGNLCDMLPGKAIGGDRFGNREGQLPNQQGRIWYEADINYRCGHRGADRLVYSNDGLIYVTTNHYKTFRQIR